MSYLGIDAGASATKWAVADDAQIIFEGETAAMDGHVYRSSSASRMRAVLAEIASHPSASNISGVTVGITGYAPDNGVEEIFSEFFSCPTKVMTDIELAFEANFPNKSGILLYAGTGSVLYARKNNGEKFRIGGWGYLLGDEGAGYWIGREALRATMIQLDGFQEIPPNSLFDKILKSISANNWDGIKKFVYSSDRSEIAKLSHIVRQAAEQEDNSSLKILHSAATHLLNLVESADGVMGDSSTPVAFTGGVSAITEITTDLSQILGDRLVVSTINIAAETARLASQR